MTISKYILSAWADDDLESTWSYIAADKPSAAETWIRKLFVEFEKLAKMPSMGHSRDDVTDNDLLFWIVGNYLIVYRGRDPIEIVAVVHGARDIPALLDRRLSTH